MNSRILRLFLPDLFPLIVDYITPSKVKFIRLKYKLSQANFAQLIGVKYHTYKAWEIGHRHPSSPACAILTIADKFPENFLNNREEIIKYATQNF